MANANTINIWQRLRRNSPPELWDKLEGLNPCTPDEMDPPEALGRAHDNEPNAMGPEAR